MVRTLPRPSVNVRLPSRLPKPQIPRLPDPSQPDEFVEMTLAEHLEELKSRILRCIIALVGGLIIGFLLSGRVLHHIAADVNNGQGLDIKSPTDTITVYFKVAMYVAVAIVSPVLLYQAIAFLAPGLTNREKRIVYMSLPFVSFLFILGAAYAYLFAIPRALQFLSNFQRGTFQESADAQETVGFYLTLMVGLGLAFQLPVIMFLLSKINILSVQKMRKWRKYSYLLIIIAAAVITPTSDPVNLSLVAVPMMILYEIGLILARYMG